MTGTALEFDGVDQWVSTLWDGIASDNPRSIACWMKSAQTSSNGLVTWGFANGSGGLWNLMLNPEPADIGTPGVPRTEIDGGRVVGDTTINDDIWNHVVSAYDGGSLADVLFYKNGTAQTSTNSGITAVDTITNNPSSINVSLARRANYSGNHYDGLLSDVRVFNKALTQNEVNILAAIKHAEDNLTQVRQHNSLNQITRLDNGAAKTSLTYDLNGNLLDDGTRIYIWDALNRLKEVKRKSDGELIAQYTYDAMNRRIRKEVFNGGLSGNIPNNTLDYLYSGWQCCEERKITGSTETLFKQYLWGIYIDELIQQQTHEPINGNPAGEYYPLQDLLYRTTALTDSSGTIAETYDTDAYGNTLIFTASGTGGDWWADDAVQGNNPTCALIFTGRRLDSESELYYYRDRYYFPAFRRFLTRDPRKSQSTAAGLYLYAASNPNTHVDPDGRQCTFVGLGRVVRGPSYKATAGILEVSPDTNPAMLEGRPTRKIVCTKTVPVSGLYNCCCGWWVWHRCEWTTLRDDLTYRIEVPVSGRKGYYHVVGTKVPLPVPRPGASIIYLELDLNDQKDADIQCAAETKYPKIKMPTSLPCP